MSTVVQQGVFVGFPNRDWQAATHPQLLKPVESVREHFAQKAKNLRETILKDVSEGQPPLGISLHPPISVFPPKQKFEYCLGLWHKGLVELLKHCFHALLQVAAQNLSLVIGDPVMWAYGHAHALWMEELEISDKPDQPEKPRPGGKLLRVRLWIKAFFDPPNNPDPEMLKSREGFEERLFRTNWRAPRCLWSFANPRILCDEAEDWERLDHEKTEQLLDVVVSRFLRGVELRLQEEARKASIGTATQGIPALANVSQPEPETAPATLPVPCCRNRESRRRVTPPQTEVIDRGIARKATDAQPSSRRNAESLVAARKRGGPQFEPLSSDYRSILFKRKTYALTRNQSIIIKILHEAYVKGAPVVAKDTLLRAIEAETSRVRDSFKHSPLWKTLIIPIRKPRGTFKLNLK